jgi:hypothetical protein
MYSEEMHANVAWSGHGMHGGQGYSLHFSAIVVNYHLIVGAVLKYEKGSHFSGKSANKGTLVLLASLTALLNRGCTEQ